MLGRVDLALTECVGGGIFGFLGPYLQDRIRCDGRFQGRLGIYISFASKYVSFEVSVVGEVDNPTMVPGYGQPFCRSWYYSVICFLNAEKMCIDLIALTPREHVVHFRGELARYDVKDLLATMPNMEVLSLGKPVISDVFLRPNPLSDTKLLPFLRYLSLDHPTLQNHGDWRSLITYLIHQTPGGRAISFGLCRGHPPVPPEVARVIEDLVEEFDLDLI